MLGNWHLHITLDSLVSWVLALNMSDAVGDCRWSGTHPAGLSTYMPSQFWSGSEEMAPPLWYPQRYNLDRNLEDIALILYALSAISAHGCVSQGSLEPGPSGPEMNAQPTGSKRPTLLSKCLLNQILIWKNKI